MEGSVITEKGRALLGKILATQGTLQITGAQIGDGDLPVGTPPASMEALSNYVMDATIVSITNPDRGEVKVTLQVLSEDVETAFLAREVDILALDPDEGEIVYCYVPMQDDPVQMRAAGDVVGKLLTMEISKTYGGAQYASNGVPDIGADSMIKVCPETSTDFSKIVPGAVVWMSGHIGIYIGDGLAVECSPKWANRVQITACNCTKAGYNRRDWTKWGKLPYITYTEENDMDEKKLKELIRQTVREVMEEMDPVIKDLRDVPSYWQGAAQAMLETGAVNGGTSAEVNPTDLNLRRETFKAAVVAVNYTDAVVAKIRAENTPENGPENGTKNDAENTH